MKTTWGAAIVVALAAGWFALPGSARAEDEALRQATAEIGRLKAENRHLREAQDQAGKALRRTTDALERLQNRYTELKDRVAAFEREGVGEERLVDGLKERIAATHAFYRKLLVSIGKPTVKPLLALLKEDPVGGMPWIGPIFAAIGPDAAEAAPYLKSVVADERHRRRGVARYAEEALAGIEPEK